jgi:hypothetical protein
MQIRKRKVHVVSVFKLLPVLSNEIKIGNRVDKIELKMVEIQMQ